MHMRSGRDGVRGRADASMDASGWRWLQDGSDLVLCIDLAEGHLLVTPGGSDLCEVRLTHQSIREVERLTQALAAAPGPARICLGVALPEAGGSTPSRRGRRRPALSSRVRTGARQGVRLVVSRARACDGEPEGASGQRMRPTL
jgi:hypothetical protein